jgi:hypothetical protein
MNAEVEPKIFAELPRGLILLAVALAIPCYELFNYFGRADGGRIAAFLIIVLVGVIAKSRPLWTESWFWIFLLCVTALHTAVIMLVPWPDPHYPALILAPFTYVDYFVIIALIKGIATRRSYVDQ